MGPPSYMRSVVDRNVVNAAHTCSLQVCVETEKCLSGCGRTILFSVDILTFCILGCVGAFI